MSILEKRFESRYLCAELVSVAWSDPANPSGIITQTGGVILEDISALGACVQLEEPIPIGSSITLTIGRSRLDGHVSYSVFRDYGCFVGIRFSEGTIWSLEMVVPEHLTNLKALGLVDQLG